MVTVTQIEKILEKHPEGLKGRQIADILRVDKKSVNSILYQNKGKLFIQNDNYVWKIKRGKKAEASPSVPKVDKALTSNLPEKVQPVILDHISVIKCNDHRPNIGKVVKKRRFVRRKIYGIPAKLRYRPHEIDSIQVCLERDGKYYRVGYISDDMKQYFTNHINDNGMTADISRFQDFYTITLNVPFVIKPVQSGLPETTATRQPSIVHKANNQHATTRPALVQHDAVADVPFVEKKSQSRLLNFLRAHKFVTSLMVIAALFFGKNAIDDARSDNYVRTSILTKEYIYRTYETHLYLGKVRAGAVGDEWKAGELTVYVNGKLVSDDTITVRPGDYLRFEGYVMESDPSWNDYGHFSGVMYQVTQDSLQGRIKIPVKDIEVKENGGRYSGAIAHADASITLIPIN